jgi:hypothetical protein
MTVRPIIFSSPMVRALLAGTKTQTRRILKPAPFIDPKGNFCVPDRKGRVWNYGQDIDGRPCTRHFQEEHVRYAPGDLLWVRETCQVVRVTLDYETGGEFDCFAWDDDQYGAPTDYLHGCARTGVQSAVYYGADGEETNPGHFYPVRGFREELLRPQEINWRPSIHMPRWASRLTLEVTGVKVERLNDISQEDARAEGIPRSLDGTEPSPLLWFRELWDSINGKREGANWGANPWVIAVSFAVHRCNVDSMPGIAEAA